MKLYQYSPMYIQEGPWSLNIYKTIIIMGDPEDNFAQELLKKIKKSLFSHNLIIDYCIFTAN